MAVVPPSSVLDAIERHVHELRARVDRAPARWTARAQWHLTLCFVGDDADPDAVAATLAGMRIAPAEVRLGGLGAFPSVRRARTIWIGVVDGAEWLVAAAAEIRARLEGLGPLGERPALRPHVTVARVREDVDLRSVLGDRGEPVGGSWRVAEVLVVESRRGARGSQYRTRASIPLGDGARGDGRAPTAGTSDGPTAPPGGA